MDFEGHLRFPRAGGGGLWQFRAFMGGRGSGFRASDLGFKVCRMIGACRASGFSVGFCLIWTSRKFEVEGYRVAFRRVCCFRECSGSCTHGTVDAKASALNSFDWLLAKQKL